MPKWTVYQADKDHSTYHKEGTYQLKGAADKTADHIRKNGKKARVVKYKVARGEPARIPDSRKFD